MREANVTKDKKRKRQIRDRAARTGEPYTTARAQILSKPPWDLAHFKAKVFAVPKRGENAFVRADDPEYGPYTAYAASGADTPDDGWRMLTGLEWEKLDEEGLALAIPIRYEQFRVSIQCAKDLMDCPAIAIRRAQPTSDDLFVILHDRTVGATSAMTSGMYRVSDRASGEQLERDFRSMTGESGNMPDWTDVVPWFAPASGAR